jgi:hypothetical protein
MSDDNILAEFAEFTKKSAVSNMLPSLPNIQSTTTTAQPATAAPPEAQSQSLVSPGINSPSPARHSAVPQNPQEPKSANPVTDTKNPKQTNFNQFTKK